MVLHAPSAGRYGNRRPPISAVCLLRCIKCGTTVYEDSPNPQRTGFAGGALTATEGIVRVIDQIFVGDTGDGGLSKWLPDFPTHETDTKMPETDRSRYERAPMSASSSDALHGRCHCGGLVFDILRPSADQVSAGEFTGGIEKARASATKWAASLCACTTYDT